MALTLKTFDTILADLVNGLTPAGSALKAVVKGSRLYRVCVALAATVSLGWVELGQARDMFFVSSSTGDPLRQRVADLGMVVGQGTLSVGNLVATNGTGQTLAAGTLLRSADAVTVVEVLQDRVLTAATPIIVPVRATRVGEVHDLAAGTVLTEVAGRFGAVVFRVATSGLDSQGLPTGNLTGGTNAETDDQIKARFPDYLLSLGQGTRRAIRQALQATPGVSSLVLEWAKPMGGWVTISITDGNGDLTTELEAAVAATMESAAAGGIAYVLRRIARRNINVTVKVYTKDTNTGPNVFKQLVSDNIRGIGRNLAIGQSLYLWRIERDGSLDVLENFEVLAPLADVVASPNELLGIGVVDVQVVYV